MNYEERAKLRHDAIEKLAENGVWMSRTSTMAEIIPQVETLTGTKKLNSQMVSDYLYRWVGNEHIRINPPYRAPSKPLDLSRLRHPRLADINAAQPPFMTPRGAVGNGDEHSKVWRR